MLMLMMLMLMMLMLMMLMLMMLMLMMLMMRAVVVVMMLLREAPCTSSLSRWSGSRTEPCGNKAARRNSATRSQLRTWTITKLWGFAVTMRHGIRGLLGVIFCLLVVFYILRPELAPCQADDEEDDDGDADDDDDDDDCGGRGHGDLSLQRASDVGRCGSSRSSVRRAPVCRGRAQSGAKPGPPHPSRN
eukprot:2085216-Rhodomonas_salina.5